MKTPLLTFAALLALSACGRPAGNASNAVVTSAPANSVDMTAIPEDSDAVALDNKGANVTPALTDSWVGRWNGPEGLFLEIQAGDAPGTYRLRIKNNLDSEASYAGTAKGTTIRFSRDGKSETIRVGTGTETGYKWLAGKSDCLIIVMGKEGYCR